MKTVICAALSFTLLSSVASAQTQPNTWQGSITIRALTGAACEGLEVRVGQLGVAIYRPTIGASGRSRLQFLFNRAAVNQEKTTAGQMNGSGSYNGIKFGGRAGVDEFVGTFNLTSQPATVAANTPTVTLSGTITNFFENTGCTATITAPMTKRPAGGE